MKKLLILFFLFGFFTNANAQEIALSEFDARPYLGKYKLEMQEISAEGEIKFNQNSLFFYTEGLELKLIVMPEIDKFKADKYEIILQFIRNDFKEVETAKIWFQGREFLAKKITF